MPGIAWVWAGVLVREVMGVYRLESVSDGRPISCGSRSISLRPALLIKVLCITGSSINDLILFNDHEVSMGIGLS